MGVGIRAMRDKIVIDTMLPRILMMAGTRIHHRIARMVMRTGCRCGVMMCRDATERVRCGIPLHGKRQDQQIQQHDLQDTAHETSLARSGNRPRSASDTGH